MAPPAPRFRNPVLAVAGGLDHGDPFVMRHGDRYWLFHTGGRGVPVYESRDLVTWQPAGTALQGATGPDWAQVDLWAPEVLALGGELLMYVAGTRPGPRRDDTRRIALARARSPVGPFTWEPEPVVGDRWAIDAHPFRDVDGSLWLFYNTRDEQTRYLDGTVGTGNVVDRLLGPERVAGRPWPVAVPDARWEGNLAGNFYWNEGPWVMRRRDRYWQMYSGGSFAEPTYAVGVASAEQLQGPWHKDPANPILRGGRALRGPGHHCVVTAPDGVTPYAVYHARVAGRPGRVVCVDRVWWTGARPVVGRDGAHLPSHPTAAHQPMPPGPVHDARVASWHAELCVRGLSLSAGSATIALDGEGPHQVQATQRDGALIIHVDGMVRPTLPAVAGPAELAVDGDILDRRVTSCLAVEELIPLAPGERRSWPWGGSGPLELAVAVRGEATIELGDQSRRVSTAGDWRLVSLLSPAGAGTIEIVAGAHGGAQVTDLAAVVRDEAWASSAAARPGVLRKVFRSLTRG